MKSACITPSHCVSWGAILLIAGGVASGQSWRQINSGLPVTVAGARSLTFDPTTPSIVYGVGPNGTLFKSNDGGQSWNAISRATSVRSVVVDPKNSGNVYALARNGVLKSADHGETWTVANTGFAASLAGGGAGTPAGSDAGPGIGDAMGAALRASAASAAGAAPPSAP